MPDPTQDKPKIPSFDEVMGTRKPPIPSFNEVMGEKKNGGGNVVNGSGVSSRIESTSPSIVNGGSQQVFPTKENPTPLIKENPTVYTFDGTPLAVNANSNTPFSYALSQSSDALKSLQQRVLTGNVTDEDLNVLSAGNGKSTDVIKAYVKKGSVNGSLVDAHEKNNINNQFLKQGIQTIGDASMQQFNTDHVLSDPDAASKFLSIAKSSNVSVPVKGEGNTEYEMFAAGKLGNNQPMVKVGGVLTPKAKTGVIQNPQVTIDNQKRGKQLVNDVVPLLVNKISEQTAKQVVDGTLSAEDAASVLFKRVDPENYQKNLELSNTDPTPTTDKVATSLINATYLAKNIIGAITNSDEKNKELLNAQRVEYELKLNQGMNELATNMMAEGVANNNQEQLDKANLILPHIKPDEEIIQKSPILMKQEMANYINQRAAKEAGLLEGTETETREGAVIKNTGVNSDIAKKYLTEGGYFNKANFKDYANDVADNPTSYLADNSTFGGIGMNFFHPFVSIAKGLADLSGANTKVDRAAEVINDQMFPSTLTENIKPDFKVNVLGEEFKGTWGQTFNSVASLGGYIAGSYLTGGVGKAIGASEAAIARASAFSTFGLDAVHPAITEAEQLGLDTPATALYTALKVAMMTEGGRILEAPFQKRISDVVVPGMSEDIAKVAMGLSNKSITEKAGSELLDNAFSKYVNTAKKYGLTSAKAIADYAGQTAKGAGVMSSFGVGDKLIKVAFGDPNAKMEDILPEAAHAYFDGLLTMGILGTFGLAKNMAKNSSFKAGLTNAIDNHDAAKDVLTVNLRKGLLTEDQYNERVAVINTGLRAKATYNDAVQKIGVDLTPNQRSTWIANATAEKVLRDQSEKDGVTESDAKKFTEQVDNLAEQNSQIFNGLKFSKSLDPQYNLYNAKQELEKAQDQLIESDTPENQQLVSDKKATFDKLNEDFNNGKFAQGIPIGDNVPAPTDASTTNEAVDNVSQKAEAGTNEADIILHTKDNGDKITVADINKLGDLVSPDDVSKKFDVSPGTALDIFNKWVDNNGKPLAKMEGKVIVEPSKPISEMDSQELRDYSDEVSNALAQHEKIFADKTEAEKEAAGYYDYIGNVSDLRDTAQRINFVENSENLDELVSSTKAAIRDLNKDNPSEESLAILNAVKKKAAEMNIAPETLIKEVIKKVGNDYKDKDDAELMMRDYLEKIVPTETKAEQQPIVNSNSDAVPTTTEVSPTIPTEIKEPKGQGNKEDVQPSTEPVGRPNAEATHPVLKEGKYEAKARKIVEDLNKKAEKLPSWLINTDPNTKSAGLDSNSLLKILGDATIEVGKLMDRGVEFADAIKRGADKLIDDYKKGINLNEKANLKPELEKQLRDGFEQHYKDNILEGEPQKSDAGKGNKPPTSEVKVEEGEDNTIGIRHIDTAEMREEFSLPEYQKEVETIEQWNLKADERIKKGEMPNVIKKFQEGDLPSAVEQVMMGKYIAELGGKARETMSDKDIKSFHDAVKLSDRMGGSEWGASGRARQIEFVRDDSLEGFILAKLEANKVDVLTDKQKDDVKYQYGNIDAAEKKWETEKKRLEDKIKKLEADNAVKKYTKPKSDANKTHDDYVKERQNLKDKLNQQVEDYKAAGRKLGAVSDGNIESFIITAKMAKTISEIVKSHVFEIGNNLGEVTKRTFDDVKDFFTGISESDIHDVIAGKYNEPQKTRSQKMKDLVDLKTQARLVSKLSDLQSGKRPTTEKKIIERNREIAELRRSISDFEKENPDNAAKLAALKKRYATEIKKVQDDIDNKRYAPPPKEPSKIILDKEALDAKDELIRLKNERHLGLLREKMAAMSTTEKAIRGVAEIANIPRSIMSSGDLSAPLRQAIIPVLSHPTLALKSGKLMVEAAVSQKAYDRWFFDFQQSPKYDLMSKSKLGITESTSPLLTAREEAFMSNLAERIPVVGSTLIKGSERAYTLFLNKMRVDLFNRFADSMEARGLTFENSPEQYKQMAAYVNNSTGRGDLGNSLNKVAPLLNSLFFSPRLIASRINMLTYLAQPRFYNKVPKEVRRAYFTDMAKFIALGATVLSLASLNKDDKTTVETDPTSSDFGKIRNGNTRWDIWGGFQQYIRVASQAIMGKRTSNGKTTPLGEKSRFGETRLTPIIQSLRGKLAPVPSMALDLFSGRTIIGDKVTYEFGIGKPMKYKEVTIDRYVRDHLLPLTFTGMSDALQDQGAKAWLTVGLPSIFGVGVQTYDSKKKNTKSNVTRGNY